MVSGRLRELSVIACNNFPYGEVRLSVLTRLLIDMRPLYWLGSKAYSIVFEIERWQISRSVTDVTNETDLIQYSSRLETG